MSPADHALRRVLNDEVHARPPEQVRPPVRLSYLALIPDQDRAADIKALHDNAQFIRITSASMAESHPHDIVITKEAPNYSR